MGTSAMTSDDSPCPRCDGTGKYLRFPGCPVTPCAVCNGTGIINEANLAVWASLTPEQQEIAKREHIPCHSNVEEGS